MSKMNIHTPRRVFRSLFVLCIITLVAVGTPFTLGLAASDERADATPCNANASDDAKAILAYLADLSSDDAGKAIVGQNCYHGNESTDASPLNGYNAMVTELYNQTGQWVGIVGVDYEYMAAYSPEELSQANKVLINHWKKGGLVTVTFSPLNPWVIDETGSHNAPATWNAPGSPTDRSNVKLGDLVKPSAPVYQVWRKKLDRIAAAIAELRDAGVVVLWRPMQENNGNWFWWGDNPTSYIKVYRDMYDYFTNEKKLNNLLWVYSPYGAMSDYRTYPGDDYVDIVGPTFYNDQLEVYNYRQLSSLGKPRKPFAIAEYGPDTEGPLAKTGKLDDLTYINRIRKQYPRAAYWVCWHSYPTEHWSLVSCQNAKALMNDPDVITVERLGWRK